MNNISKLMFSIDIILGALNLFTLHTLNIILGSTLVFFAILLVYYGD